MSIHKTTFRIAQRTVTGPEGLKLALLALREVLPYCLIDCVQLNRVKFPINTARYPQGIWHELLRKREWHDKLIYHLANSLAEQDHAKRMTLQGEFARLITDPESHVTLHGTMLYESEGTPDMLEAAGLPMVKSFGCELQVDAYTEYRKQTQRNQQFKDSHASQRGLYEQLVLADVVERAASPALP